MEALIADEMKDTSGACVYNGCNCSGTHYVGLHKSFCTCSNIQVRGKTTVRSEHQLTLIAPSHMSQITDGEKTGISRDETEKFNSEAHINFFEEVMRFYSSDFRLWYHRIVSHNSNLNMIISKLTKIPHVGCNRTNLILRLMPWLSATMT